MSFMDAKPSADHIVLQQSMNHDHYISDHMPFPVLNANRGAVSGMSWFEERWCSKDVVALHWHVELVILMSLPFSFVLVHGR